MALAETETWQGGFIRDDSGNLVVTTDPAEEVFGTVVPGFLTDGDGRLVATYEPDEDTRTVVPGFVTDTSGRLAIASEVADPVYTVVPGFATDSSGYLSTQEGPASGTYEGGFVRDTDAALAVGSTYVASPYEEAVLALSPTLFLPLDSVNGLANLADTDYTATGAGSITVGGATPGPLNVGDAGATTFDGSDDRITTDYGTRRNFCQNPRLAASGVWVGASGTAVTYGDTTFAPPNAPSGSVATLTSPGSHAYMQENTAAPIQAAAPGDYVRTSAYIRADAANTADRNAYAVVLWLDAAKNGISEGSHTGVSIIRGAEWAQVGATVGPAPANTAWAICRIYGGLNASSGEKFYVTQPLYEVGSTLGTYFDGAGYESGDTPGEGEWIDDPGGHVGWLGTAHASASDLGCYANGCDRTYMGWAYRDAAADADTLIAADIAAPPTLALNSGDQDVLFKPENSTATTWSDTWPDNGEWVHWALVFEEVGNDATLYINGVADASTNAAQFAATNANFMVGAYNASTDPFDGNMAFVSVHEEALSEAQIQAAYAAGS